MGLKQSIIIKSEYTNNARSKPGKGSRGASPGAYVMRYMAREDATEVLAPVKHDYNSDKFIRYISRSEATENLKNKDDDLLTDDDAYGSPLVLKHRFRKMDKLSGRAFGSRGISLSQRELEDSSESIQESFDEGHSVQKIILSFTEEYLRETGVLDEDFRHKGRGSYKGYIDQLKLRDAISRGVSEMTKTGRFEDPEWVGTIQIDTSYVHSHIALVDKEFSDFRMCDDRADRGKINEREKKSFRKGINYGLEEMKDLKSFHKQTSLERQNVVSFVKDYAYGTINENTQVQLLIASLPKERNDWRYGTNKKSMQYPNEMAKNIIESTFKNDPIASGYDKAINSVKEYADESARLNRYNDEEKQNLIDNGYNMIVERSVNGLYKTLKDIDPESLHVRTSMIDLQSSSDDELKNALMLNSGSGDGFDSSGFVLRVRGYNRRKDVHEKLSSDFNDMSNGYENAYEQGFVDNTAMAMRLFYEQEQRYHMGLTDKYRYFLSFNHDIDRKNIEIMNVPYDDLTDRFNSIKERESTEDVNLDKELYKKDLKKYTYECFDKGVGSLKEWQAIVDFKPDEGLVSTNFVLPIRAKTCIDNIDDLHFNDVKALDVHHLGLDFYNCTDVTIDSTNALVFAEAFEDRRILSESARVYVTNTNQGLKLLDDVEDDLSLMKISLDKALSDGVIDTVKLEHFEDVHDRQMSTISVDRSIDFTDRVNSVLLDIDYSTELE